MMTHEYTVNGMSCMGCKNHVQEALQNTQGVVEAQVDLEKGLAVVTMESHIPLSELQAVVKAAGAHYSIVEKGTAPEQKSEEVKKKALK